MKYNNVVSIDLSEEEVWDAMSEDERETMCMWFIEEYPEKAVVVIKDAVDNKFIKLGAQD